MNFIFTTVQWIRLIEDPEQTVVGLLNSACGGLHQYVVLNSWLFKLVLSFKSFS